MTLSIHLDEGTSYEPGSRVSGRVEWRVEGEPPDKLLISLLWHTEGKGTEDVEIIEQQDVDHPGLVGQHCFEVQLPSFPWSFSGTLISLIWAIEASLEPGGTVERIDLVSAPGAEEVRL